MYKQSQSLWVKDKGPVVETNIGWIETYLDPAKVRGSFSGFVAIVDKKKTEKFQNLLKKSEEIIQCFPWPRFMEKETFIQPDFTTLDVINFASSNCPLGINLPNFDDIRENEGFKNVYLSNCQESYKINNI